jgi:hypothetical protein
MECLPCSAYLMKCAESSAANRLALSTCIPGDRSRLVGAKEFHFGNLKSLKLWEILISRVRTKGEATATLGYESQIASQTADDETRFPSNDFTKKPINRIKASKRQPSPSLSQSNY